MCFENEIVQKSWGHRRLISAVAIFFIFVYQRACATVRACMVCMTLTTTHALNVRSQDSLVSISVGCSTVPHMRASYSQHRRTMVLNS